MVRKSISNLNTNLMRYEILRYSTILSYLYFSEFAKQPTVSTPSGGTRCLINHSRFKRCVTTLALPARLLWVCMICKCVPCNVNFHFYFYLFFILWYVVFNFQIRIVIHIISLCGMADVYRSTFCWETLPTPNTA